MSKLIHGVWRHRLWCNHSNQGPCKCCDRHPEWPYEDDLLKKFPGKTLGEALDAEVKESWPLARKRV